MLAFLLLALAASAPATQPPPPVQLRTYIRAGRFDPGDYAWLEGAFADATPAARVSWRSIDAWQKSCFATGQARVRAQLVALGIRDPKLPPAPYGDPVCSSVSIYTGASAGRASFAQFRKDAATANPIARAFLFATRLAEDHGGPRGPTLADKLAARPLSEQMLRQAMSWGAGEASDAPPVAPGVRSIVVAELGAAMSERDHANTEWLKAIVAKQGWPRRSVVGEHQAGFAWLLVQHADLDPAFQLEALRLMEPLVSTGDVSKQNYAYLYDRVFLKISGKQRYATQMTCRGGRYVPLPLEDEAAVPRRRIEVALDPLDAYVAQMKAMAGECPPP